MIRWLCVRDNHGARGFRWFSFRAVQWDDMGRFDGDGNENDSG